MTVRYEWRGWFSSHALNALHAEGFGHKPFKDDWWDQVNTHSLGWVCAFNNDELVGFVNVAWDGAVHAFILDTLVTNRMRHQGVGRQLLANAITHARTAGCEWLHADYDQALRPFYEEACDFVPTPAGLVQL